MAMRSALIVLAVATLLWAVAAYQLHVYVWIDVVERVVTGESAILFPLFYGPFLVIYFVAPFVVAASITFIAFLFFRGRAAPGT